MGNLGSQITTETWGGGPCGSRLGWGFQEPSGNWEAEPKDSRNIGSQGSPSGLDHP
jgi:hypothetical protein